MSRHRNPYGLALQEALRALTLTLVPILLISILAWSFAGSRNGQLSDAVHGGAWIWLAAHKVLLHLSLPPGDIAGLLWFTPLGFLIFPIIVLRGACKRMAKESSNYRGGLTLLATAYGTLLGIVALLSSTHAVRPNSLSAFAAGVVLTLIAAFSLQLPHLLSAKGEISRIFKSALLNIAGLLVFSLVLFLISTAINFSQLINLYSVLRAGLVGTILITVVMVLALPNAVAMTMAYVSGAGFAIGSGSVFSPFSIHSSEIPALPILAALPAQTNVFTHMLPVVLFIWSIFTGYRSVTSGMELKSCLRDGALHGLASLVLLISLNVLAGGALLGGRLSAVGASFWHIALFGGPILILGGTFGALCMWLLDRSHRSQARI